MSPGMPGKEGGLFLSFRTTCALKVSWFAPSKDFF